MSADETVSSDEGPPEEHHRGPGRAMLRVLLAVGLVLALGATVALAFSDSAYLLRLGVIAALWAALAGAFIAARYRGEASTRAEEIETLHNSYELELERATNAAHEREREIEEKARQEAAERHSEQLTALRAELNTLREHLETLLGGEVLVERVALHAESTRMLNLGEGREYPMGQQAGPERMRGAAAGQPGMGKQNVLGAEPADRAPTDRARAEQPANQQRHPRWSANPANAGQINRADVNRAEAARAPANTSANTNTTANAAAPSDPVATPTERPRQRPAAEHPTRQPGADHPRQQHPPRHRTTGPGAGPREPADQQGNGRVPAIDPSWTPSWESEPNAGGREQPAWPSEETSYHEPIDPDSVEPARGSTPAERSRQRPDQPAQPPARQQRPPHARGSEPRRPRGEQRDEPVESPRRAAANGRPTENGHAGSGDAQPDWSRSWQPDPRVYREATNGNGATGNGSSGHGAGSGAPAATGPSATGGTAMGNGHRPSAPTGGAPTSGARSADPEVLEPTSSETPAVNAPAAESPAPQWPSTSESRGGRRRRPDNVSFTDSFGSADQLRRTGERATDPVANSGRHEAPAEPAEEPHSSGTEEQASSTGAHSSGRTVAELLAANGLTDGARRRRRRED